MSTEPVTDLPWSIKLLLCIVAAPIVLAVGVGGPVFAMLWGPVTALIEWQHGDGIEALIVLALGIPLQIFGVFMAREVWRDLL